LVFGRITAEATCKAKAFELAVEKVAEPRRSDARTGKEQAGGAGADLDTSGLFGAESVTAKNGRTNGSPCGANVGAIGVDDGTKRRGRRGPDRRDQERIRNQYCDNSTGDRKTVNA